MIEIKDKHIKEAERLLINGESFEKKERVPFIKELNSCDLLAVPGSGKTTALLAKLYCLSKHLPLENGSGILVLSHTNAAVNEIERKLKNVVPSLFEYPNYVGTVQSFVNKFLVLPFYSMYLNDVNVQIDGDIYYKEFDRVLDQTYSSEISYFKFNNKDMFYNSRFWYDDDGNQIISQGISNEKLKLKIPQKWTREKTAESKEKKVFEFISCVKNCLIQKGILHYDDCYFIGNEYLEKQYKLNNILQKRFRYVFIDEMQDLEKHQIDIIDKIFLCEESPTKIQRIGDINQSIYSSGKKLKTEADWEVRKPAMYLNDSNRLTKEVADVVNFLTLDRQKDGNGNPRFVVNGKRELESVIKPHIVLFDNYTKGLLKEKFSELIKKNGLEKTKEGKKYGFKIIGWNAKWDDEDDHRGKLRLEDIFDNYKKDINSPKETYSSLSEYLQCFDKNKKTLGAARKSILNALTHILRVEGLKYTSIIRGKEREKYYTNNELIKHVKEEINGSDYELFKHKIYRWSFDLAAKQKRQEVYDNIKEFVNADFKDWLNFNITGNTNDFIGNEFQKLIQVEDKKEENQSEGINIEIGTVHSVKGQTHCATMYVETAHKRPVYDSEKIIKDSSNPLLKQEHQCTGQCDKQALKMMYVGFSRPTHLLCFAVLKENIKDKIDRYEDNGWEVLDLTI